MADEILVERLSDDIRRITFNRPNRLNAVTCALMDELMQVVEDLEKDEEARVVILRGAGRAFSTGDDLGDFENQIDTEDQLRRFIGQYQHVSKAILDSPKIFIAQVHGWAVGGALEWVINCDFSVFSRETRCFFPEVTFGLFVTGGVASLLTKQVGPQRTKDLILFGEKFDAQAALDLGIAGRVVEPDALEETVLDMARRICERPRQSVVDLKRVINAGYHLDVEAAMALETDAAVRGFLDPDTAARVGGAGVRN